MRIVDSKDGRTVEEHGSSGATWAPVGEASGKAHIGVMRIEPGGFLGRHAAPLDQLFLVVQGRGWVAGSDGARVDVVTGEGATWSAGEHHESGSDTGMTAVIVQADDLSS